MALVFRGDDRFSVQYAEIISPANLDWATPYLMPALEETARLKWSVCKYRTRMVHSNLTSWSNILNEDNDARSLGQRP